MVPYINALNANAFGNYRDVLEDITLNPAMGAFLNMATNTKTKSENDRLIGSLLQQRLFLKTDLDSCRPSSASANACYLGRSRSSQSSISVVSR